MAGADLDVSQIQALIRRIRTAEPVLTVLKTVFAEGITVAEGIISRAPAGGARSGTAGSTYYKRRVGSIYVSKSGAERITKASEDLTQTWESAITEVALNAQMILQSTASYAGYVMGGTGDTTKQSALMKSRGWNTTDAIGEKIIAEVEPIISQAIDQLMAEIIQ